ncbi:extensin family protein [Arsenicicoccus sp. oral taxon 190]|uniref:extensin family protein n=1 Tax=Arsenicicoccus sp. oral taxon 190 TaxID=1658671 RepID=UPI0012E28FB5|nr:extensin family protein [Arsenicicoccus sp. oral taxon 190]
MDQLAQDDPATPSTDPTSVAAEQLPRHDQLAGTRLYYEISGTPTGFRIEPAFAARLSATLARHWTYLPAPAPTQIWSYGAWVRPEDRPRPSWHHAGRAFDLARVRASDGQDLVSCRYDLWQNSSGAQRAAIERAYWRMAASLHHDFEFVLTYLYDEAHHNHIHVDDGRSGPAGSTFSPGSRVQVQAVQAMCRHVWGHDIRASGSWDDDTRSATQDVLERVGVGGRLTQGQRHWRAFLDGTARRS